jgi:hypothetical protein
MNGVGERRLMRAILAETGAGEIRVAESREWLSATLGGLHCRLDLTAPAEAGPRLRRLRPEALAVPGQSVADLRVVGAVPDGPVTHFMLEALTVQSC